MKTDHIRRLNVDLAIDSDEDLSSPPPNGAKFNWITLKLDLPEQSSESMTPLTPIRKDSLSEQSSESIDPSAPVRKGSLVRSPGLDSEKWQKIIEARKLLLPNSDKSGEESSQDVELSGDGD